MDKSKALRTLENMGFSRNIAREALEDAKVTGYASARLMGEVIQIICLNGDYTIR